MVWNELRSGSLTAKSEKGSFQTMSKLNCAMLKRVTAWDVHVEGSSAYRVYLFTNTVFVISMLKTLN